MSKYEKDDKGKSRRKSTGANERREYDYIRRTRSGGDEAENEYKLMKKNMVWVICFSIIFIKF